MNTVLTCTILPILLTWSHNNQLMGHTCVTEQANNSNPSAKLLLVSSWYDLHDAWKVRCQGTRVPGKVWCQFIMSCNKYQGNWFSVHFFYFFNQNTPFLKKKDFTMCLVSTQNT